MYDESFYVQPMVEYSTLANYNLESELDFPKRKQPSSMFPTLPDTSPIVPLDALTHHTNLNYPTVNQAYGPVHRPKYYVGKCPSNQFVRNLSDTPKISKENYQNVSFKESPIGPKMVGGVCDKTGSGPGSGKACLPKNKKLNQKSIPNYARNENVKPPPGNYVNTCANCYINIPPHNTLLPEHTQSPQSSPVEELTCCCGRIIKGVVKACQTTTLPLTGGSCEIENKNGNLTYTKNCS